jgi:hypothetical protein
MHSLELWLLFLSGAALHILNRAGYALRSKRHPSRRSYLAANWDILLYRQAVGAALFWAWASGALAAFDLGLELPVTHLTAFGAGLLTDYLLDKAQDRLPFLRSEIPHANGDAKDEPPTP